MSLELDLSIITVIVSKNTKIEPLINRIFIERFTLLGLQTQSKTSNGFHVSDFSLMDTTQAAAHALSKGWILPSDTEKIKDQKVQDEKK